MGVPITYVSPNGIPLSGLQSVVQVDSDHAIAIAQFRFATLTLSTGVSQTWSFSKSGGSAPAVGECVYSGASWTVMGTYSTPTTVDVGAYWPDGTYDYWSYGGICSQPVIARVGNYLVFGENRYAAQIFAFDLVAKTFSIITSSRYRLNSMFSNIAGDAAYFFDTSYPSVLQKVTLSSGAVTTIGTLSSGTYVDGKACIVGNSAHYGTSSKLVKFDRSTETITEFAVGASVDRLTAGGDGRLYGLTGSNSIIASMEMDGSDLHLDPAVLTTSYVPVGATLSDGRVLYVQGY